MQSVCDNMVINCDKLVKIVNLLTSVANLLQSHVQSQKLVDLKQKFLHSDVVADFDFNR